MSSTVGSVDSDLLQMHQIVSLIESRTHQIGTAADTPFFRDSIRSKIEVLNSLSRSLKSSLLILQDSHDQNVSTYERRFNALNSRMTTVLHRFVPQIHDQQSRPPVRYTEPSDLLLGRDSLNEETDRIDMLENEVRQVLTTMREVNQLFRSTMEEIRRQRNLLTKIDVQLEGGKEKMLDGAKESKVANEHMRKSSKCICNYCLVVVAIVAIVAGVIYFLCFYKR
jgi:hypothetical protein